MYCLLDDYGRYMSINNKVKIMYKKLDDNEGSKGEKEDEENYYKLLLD